MERERPNPPLRRPRCALVAATTLAGLALCAPAANAASESPAATSPPAAASTTPVVTVPTKTVTQTRTVTAPTVTQSNTVIKTETVTAPAQTSTGTTPNGAALGAAAAAAHDKEGSEESEGLPGWAWVLIGAAAAALLIWAVSAIRRGKRPQPGEPGAVGPPQDVPPVPGEGPPRPPLP